MSLASLVKGNGPSGFGYGSTAEEVARGLDLHGKHVLVTGVGSGLGLETMRVLASRGATVIGAARSLEKAKEACASVQGSTIAVGCELAEPASVRAAVDAVCALDVALDAIVCNAGVMALPNAERIHGIERQLFTNHVGHFILVTGLLDRLAPDGRVVMLSSAAHTNAPSVGVDLDDLGAEKRYTPWGNYGQSKLANLLFARELARRFQGTKRVANAVHPGVIVTNLWRHMPPAAQRVFDAVGRPLFLKSIPQGAATQVWAAVHPGAATINGEYLKDNNVARSSAKGADMDLAARLWAATEAIVARV